MVNKSLRFANWNLSLGSAWKLTWERKGQGMHLTRTTSCHEIPNQPFEHGNIFLSAFPETLTSNM